MQIDYLGNHPNLVPELAKLHFDEWRHFSPDKTYEDRVDKLTTVAESNEVPFIVVAVEDGKLIGSAALVNEDMRTRTDLSPWLASVYVKSASRNRGIASALVNSIEDKARGLGIEKLYLYTEHARGLYVKLGWQDLEACEYMGVNVSIMYKQFSPDA